MTTSARTVVRAENVGSLLQPANLLDARKRLQEGTITAAELAAIEDREILKAIELQKSVGLDVITDGEFRRPGWADTARHLNGIEPRQGPRSYPANVGRAAGGEAGFPTVVSRISAKQEAPVGWEYPFLATHARRRTKYTMAAPSYHRRYWSDVLSPRESGYATCEEFLTDIRDWLRGVATELAGRGCTYIQLDAPSYGSLCDPTNRAFHVEQGHNLDEEIAFDAALDTSVFEGLDVTGAVHVCRGNMPGGTWHSQGGYGVIAEPLFSNLDVDVVLLEYDSERAGDFGPIELIKPGTIAVLGLLTTKATALEDESDLWRRIEEAAGVKALEDLALSTQCGFASATNAPMSVDEERAKLSLVGSVAKSTWA
jgi:5-methyltetrahydropteroyltriglutamate--homocysteine methyltransferase